MPDDRIRGDGGSDEAAELRAALAAAEARIVQLEGMLHDLRRARFGQGAERVDPGQLALALGAEPPPVSTGGGDPDAPRDRKPVSERRRNRGCLPAHLERVEELVDLPDRGCPCCGREMHRVGGSRAERLDVVPAQPRVRVTIRPRYACRRCEEAGVHEAPAPARIVAGGLPTEALLVHVLVSRSTATACRSTGSAGSWRGRASTSTARPSATG